MIGKVDFGALEPYGGNVWRSFELLCYVLAKRENPCGKFTPINGSGGDGGVEFYLTHDDGSITGWQCKRFDKLGDSQKGQIKRSYASVVKHRGKLLKRWIVCTPIDFTPGADEWFSGVCSAALTGDGVEVLHCGESELSEMLTRHVDVFNFFFDNCGLSREWFERHRQRVLASEIVKAKYLPNIHIHTDVQELCYGFIGGPPFANSLMDSMNSMQFERWLSFFRNDVESFKAGKLAAGVEFKYERNEVGRSEVSDRIVAFRNEVEGFRSAFNQLKNLMTEDSMAGARELVEALDGHWCNALGIRDWVAGLYVEEFQRIYFLMSALLNSMSAICGMTRNLCSGDLHIQGGASKGKTHLALHIFDKYCGKNGRKPAVYIQAKELAAEYGVEFGILKWLDFPADRLSFGKFLDVLNLAGEAEDCRTLLIIDGLNELYDCGRIWRRDLDRLIKHVRGYSNILLVLTYRQSYADEFGLNKYLADEENLGKVITVNGFEFSRGVDAVATYMGAYGVEVIGRIADELQARFEYEPLMLRLFCEQHSGGKVEMDGITLHGIFDGYLSECNNRIREQVGKMDRLNIRYLDKALGQIADYLWDGNSGFVPMDWCAEHFPGTELQAWDSEELLVMREIMDGRECMMFTYDRLAGYVIARQMLSKVRDKRDLTSLVNSEPFQTKLLVDNGHGGMHPLRDVILVAFFAMAIERFGFFYSDDMCVDKDVVAEHLFAASSTALDGDAGRVQGFVKDVLLDAPHLIFKYSGKAAMKTAHPLNFDFVSDVLMQVPLAIRDLRYTDEIRKSILYQGNAGSAVEEILRAFSDTAAQGDADAVRLALKRVIWLLPTTVTSVRYDVVKALYDFVLGGGVRHFIGVLPGFMGCDDDYVREGLMAVAYGAALAYQDFDAGMLEIDGYLLPLAHTVANGVTAHGWLSSRHYLVRNYARLIIKLAERKGFVISDELREELWPYNTDDAVRFIDSWEDVLSAETPLMNDFSNYTLGRLIPGGGAYDNPQLKQKARAYVLEQIGAQGWNEAEFEVLDRSISESNYRHTGIEGKTERYGKKYAWTGYYRAASWLEDAGMLNQEWYEWRVPEVRFDPTFPTFGRNERLSLPPLLDAGNPDTSAWMDERFDVSAVAGILCRLISGAEYSCLWGQYAEKDETARRKVTVYITGMLVSEDKADELVEALSGEFASDHSLGESRENTNPFGAEMDCWDEASHSNRSKVSVQVGERTIEVCYPESRYIHMLGSGKLDELLKILEEGKEPDLKPIIKTERIEKEFEVLYPVARYLDEGDFGAGTYFYPCKEIKSVLGLRHQPSSTDLTDANGDVGFRVYQYLPGEWESGQQFCYLRKGLVEKVQREMGMRLVCLVWGEKETWPDKSSDNGFVPHEYSYFSIPVMA